MEGLVTFSGATLSTCSECGHRLEAPGNPTVGTKATRACQRGLSEPSINLADVDGRSQVLTIDRFALHGASVPNTATLAYHDDLLYPYPRFVNNNNSAQRINNAVVPHSPARCSSAGTSGVLDNFVYGRDLRRRPSLSKHSRASRYGFLARNPAENTSQPSMTVERLSRAVLVNSTPKSSATPLPLRSLFADSCWNRSAPKLRLRMDELASEDDAAILELSDDQGVGEEWLGYLDDDEQELDLRFDPQMGNLVRKTHPPRDSCEHAQLLISQKSAFSWTTSSTSRYIDVAAFLLDAADESDASSHTESGEHSGALEEAADDEAAAMSLSEWSSIEPPSPPSGAWRREQPRISNRRKLHKPKPIVIPPRPNDVVSIYQCDNCQHHRRSKSVPITSVTGEGRRPSRSSTQEVSMAPAPAAEVLARSSYNHEWPVPSDDSSSEYADEEYGAPYQRKSACKPCLSDVKDVLKGMKTAVPWVSGLASEMKAARSFPRLRVSQHASEPGPSHAGGYRISHTLQRSSTQGHTTRTTVSQSQIQSQPSSRKRRLSLTPTIHLPSVRVLPTHLKDQRWARAISERLGSLHDSKCRRSTSEDVNFSQGRDDDVWISVDYVRDIPPVPHLPPQFAQTAF